MIYDSIAYPYAKAIFKLAQKNNNIDIWLTVLKFLSELIKNSDIIILMNQYNLDIKQKINLIIDICNNRLHEYGKRLVIILLENNRLMLLPAIYHQDNARPRSWH